MPAGSPQLGLFLAVALGLVAVHSRENRRMAVPPPGDEPLRTLQDQLMARYPTMPHAANILFLSDPFEPGDWILTMFFRIHYRDQDIQVDRMNTPGRLPTGFNRERYQHVFTLSAGKLQESPLGERTIMPESCPRHAEVQQPDILIVCPSQMLHRAKSVPCSFVFETWIFAPAILMWNSLRVSSSSSILS